MKPTLDNPELDIGSFIMQISQFGLYQVGPDGITVYPAVFIHRSATPKRVLLGNYGGHTFLGNMKSWPVLPQILV
jgi:hypothetical protein